MSPLHIFLLLSFIFVCFLLIVSVLLQTGKGGGMAGLGGGSSDTAFGAHTANVLQKFTLYSVVVFFVLVIVLAHYSKREVNNSSVMDNFVAPQAETKPVAPTTQPVVTGTPAPATPSSTVPTQANTAPETTIDLMSPVEKTTQDSVKLPDPKVAPTPVK